MQPDLEALAAEFLGPRYAGRCFLRYAELQELGLVDNRATLNLWIGKGVFPRGLKIPGPYGKTLVWHVPELVRLLAQRFAERDREAMPPHPTVPPLPLRGVPIKGTNRNAKCLAGSVPDTFNAKSADSTGLKMIRITRGVSFE
jgi:hypothetical protein